MLHYHYTIYIQLEEKKKEYEKNREDRSKQRKEKIDDREKIVS